uniref:EF-hand domain-containing protein n=1 Tax=Picea sitchensis TaxID=3332 RepID=A9NPM0_PICSI|nr:unknown [Picea sitchensis]
MGQAWTGLQNTFKYHVSEEYLNKIIDTTFDSLPGGRDGNAQKKTITYDQLYEAIIEIFKKINEIPGANWAPPSKQSMVKMIQEYDLDQNKEIDREEFHAFVRKFSRHLVATYGRDVVIVTVAVPAAAILTKKATQSVPMVGDLLSKVPNTILYASAVAAALLVRYKFFSK